MDEPEPCHSDNHIKTSRYTIFTFLPINLFEQFRRIANAYFLLLIIITAYEDYYRHISDNKANAQRTYVFQQNIKFRGIIECELPTVNLFSFKGRCIYNKKGEGTFLFLTLENLLLRGSRLKVAKYVIELQKVFGSLFFKWDIHMYHPETNEHANSNSSEIMEDLGQVNLCTLIQYLFSDKTDTLTENDMCFKFCYVSDMEFGIVNTIDGINYQASSPDELCLVSFAKSCGMVFTKEDTLPDGIIRQINIFEKPTYYQLLENLHTYRFVLGLIYLFTKRADSVVIPLCSSGAFEVTTARISLYAKLGLRTLAVAYRIISSNDYQRIRAEFKRATQSCTAVEDRLQQYVPETLTLLRRSGIKVWILTGDRVETTVNIAYLSKVFNQEHKLLQVVNCTNLETCKTILDNQSEKLLKKTDLVIDGSSLAFVLDSDDYRPIFCTLVLQCESVLCCRLSPLQKAQVNTQ
ncbi:unnamed protein product [Didymodactylos carnosus]|uniref:P-type ATPase N-terminal domain-containing protein n=1 Tax=Didymodactylos carnosus TaxID=1234261 RepID=A0A813WHZ9_9BILA|nr:unnamed protein product [Didymodactylos carnosus]CAF0851015.1 unnamed protein product [Didymodactylos carnosus]CAF3556888.1 unnamed protein product [Didymodactylos carnosus]CAF3638649.1 unnamed protein product [Didymodactylos carnosus]